MLPLQHRARSDGSDPYWKTEFLIREVEGLRKLEEPFQYMASLLLMDVKFRYWTLASSYLWQ